MVIVGNPSVLGSDCDLASLNEGNHHVDANLPLAAGWEEIILTATSKEGITLIIIDRLQHSNALAISLELIKTLVGNPTPSGMNLLAKNTKFRLGHLKLRIESW